MNPHPSKLASASHSILLVDDVPHGLVARREVLAGIGYTVATAQSGDEAFALFLTSTRAFDVLVTDYKMPGMDGLELIRRVRQSYPGTRIVLLSGIADIMDMTEALSGADVVLSKCAGELGQLTRTIKNLLARKPAKKPASSQKKQPLRFMVKSS